MSSSSAISWEKQLPIEVKSTCEDIRMGGTKDRLLASDWMNPIQHHSNSIVPVPIDSKRKIIVLASVQVIQV